jgi:hypothetical protein
MMTTSTPGPVQFITMAQRQVIDRAKAATRARKMHADAKSKERGALLAKVVLAEMALDAAVTDLEGQERRGR